MMNRVCTTLTSLDDVTLVSYVNGQVLIGNASTGKFVQALISGTANRVTVTNGPGTIALTGPQDIHSGASPTFAGATISGGGAITATTSTLSIAEIRLGGSSFARVGRNTSDGSPFVGYNLKYTSPSYVHDSTGTTAGFVTNLSGIQFYLDPSQAADTVITASHQFTVAGNVVFGKAALATNATDGFVYMLSCAGPPTGTPTAFTGRVPWVYDSTNNKIYVYNSGWKSTAALT